MGWMDKINRAIRWKDKVTDSARGALGTVIPRPGGDPGGVPARGVVVQVLQGPFGHEDTNALWHGVTLTARTGDGPVTTVQTWMTFPAWQDLTEGRDVPLRVDPATGAVVGFDADLYEQEARQRDPQDIMNAFPSLGDPHGGDEAPIEGVTLDQWATVTARLARGGVGPFEQDAFAVTLGVPPGRWAAINAQWQQRAAADPRISVRFTSVYTKEMGF